MCVPPAPQFYNVSFSAKVEAALPTLTSVCVQGEYDATANSKAATLTGVAGSKFTVFSKTAKWVRARAPTLCACVCEYECMNVCVPVSVCP